MSKPREITPANQYEASGCPQLTGRPQSDDANTAAAPPEPIEPSRPRPRPKASKPRVIEVAPGDVGPRQEPLPHQVDAENLLWAARRCILSDDMGLGKTLPALRAAEGRTLVICPATLKANWFREIGRERPSEKIFVLGSRTAEPIPGDAIWLIINFEIVADWVDAISQWWPTTVIIDEAHTLRSNRTIMFGACRAIAWKAKRRYLLTGTPVINRPSDLISLINILGLLRKSFGGFNNYVARYCGAHQTEYGLDISGAENLGELHEILTGRAVSPHGDGERRVIMLRRTKDAILDLPAKKRRILRVQPDKEYLEYYAQCEEALRKEVAKYGSSLSSTNFESLSLVRAAVGLTKIKAAIEYIRKADEALVIFSHHVDVRRALKRAFPHALVIEAQTRNRQAIVDAFQRGESSLLITSPKIGGTGLTLTAAHRVLFVEFEFTAADHQQAEDRVHRIGQTRPVRADYLYAEGTIDGFLLAWIMRKAKIFGKLADGLADPDWLERMREPKASERQRPSVRGKAKAGRGRTQRDIKRAA